MGEIDLNRIRLETDKMRSFKTSSVIGNMVVNKCPIGFNFERLVDELFVVGGRFWGRKTWQG